MDNNISNNVSNEKLDDIIKKNTHFRKTSSINEIVDILTGASPNNGNDSIYQKEKNNDFDVKQMKCFGGNHSRKSSISFLNDVMSTPRKKESPRRYILEEINIDNNEEENNNLESIPININYENDIDNLNKKSKTDFICPFLYNYFTGFSILMLSLIIIIIYFGSLRSYIYDISYSLSNLDSIKDSMLRIKIISNEIQKIDFFELNNATKKIPEIAESITMMTIIFEKDMIMINNTINKLKKINYKF